MLGVMRQASHPAATPPSALTVRRLRIDLAPGFARRWNGGDAFTSAYFNALSMSFPLGEQFFIDSVRDGAALLGDAPADAALRATVQDFIGQEATHRHLHAQYNAELARQGFVNTWEPRMQREIARKRAAQAHLPALQRARNALAVTAALEHYTALLGHIALARIGQPGDWLAAADEPLRTLWRWHAAEESEHRAVAFDLYQRLGGRYGHRLRWFAYASRMFLLDSTRQTLANLRHDGALGAPRTWLSALRFFAGRHGLLWRMTGPLLAYLRPGFHPLQLGDGGAGPSWLRQHAGQWQAVRDDATARRQAERQADDATPAPLAGSGWSSSA